MSRGVAAVLEAIKKLDPGQQITVPYTADMGFEPAVAAVLHKELQNQCSRAPSQFYQITVEGITETTVLSYFKAMNADDLTALFTPDGALQPPFQKPIVGREAIASYMPKHKDSILCRSRAYQSYQMALQVKVTGVVQTPWFGVNVGMNIAWRFLLNPRARFSSWRHAGLSQELLSLRRV